MCLLPLRTVGRCDARRLLPSESSSDSAGGDAVPDDAGLRAECGASLTVGEHDTNTEGRCGEGHGRPWQTTITAECTSRACSVVETRATGSALSEVEAADVLDEDISDSIACQ